MPRPHIEFIQQQDLPFEERTVSGSSGPIGVKSLSRDGESGASSNLVQVPAAWARDGVVRCLVDLEIYVLSGDLSISGQRYTEHTYGFFPAGYTLEDVSSESGAQALAFTSGGVEWQTGPVPSGLLDEQRLVRYLNLYEGPWTGNFHPQFPPGAGRKWLRRDPVTADDSWILASLGLRHGRRPEKHPVVEEMYLLAGELIAPQGVMRPGAYFWRPPDAWHGPYGSKTGCLYFFRTVGGPLSTVYSDEEQDFDWDPKGYHPILPPELQYLAERRNA